MRILYLFTSASPSRHSSVQDKVRAQIRHLNKAGSLCRGAFFTTEVDRMTAMDGQVDLFPMRKATRSHFRSLEREDTRVEAMEAHVERVYDDFDVFLMRYPMVGPRFANFVRRFGRKLVLQHVCDEREELRLGGLEPVPGGAVTRLLAHIERVSLPLGWELLLGGVVRRGAMGGVCNSAEIAARQQRVAGGGYPVTVVGDGVEVAAFPLKRWPPLERTLELVFLKGASTAALYNGLDRVMEGIRHYRGSLHLRLNVVGRNLDYEIGLAQSIGLREDQVIFHPWMQGAAADEFLEHMHLGVSQFGVHRKGLSSNTTIKAREYMARGIPFLYGHHDPDMDEVPEHLAMRFPADENPVDMEHVVALAQRAWADPSQGSLMRGHAQRHLDHSVKASRLLRWLEECAAVNVLAQ